MRVIIDLGSALSHPYAHAIPHKVTEWFSLNLHPSRAFVVTILHTAKEWRNFIHDMKTRCLDDVLAIIFLAAGAMPT